MRRRVFPLTKRGWRAAQRRARRFRRLRHNFNLWDLAGRIPEYLSKVKQRERGCPRCGGPLVEDPHHEGCPTKECPFYGHPRYSCVRALVTDECTFEGRCPQVLLDYERERTSFLRVLQARGGQLRKAARKRRREVRRRRRIRQKTHDFLVETGNKLIRLFLGIGHTYLLHRARQNLVWTLKVREIQLRLEAEGRTLDEFR